MKVKRNVPRASARRRDEGMSLLEVLIAASLIVVIAVGVLPLLTRSMINNAKGWRATTSTNFARSMLEDFLEKEMGHADLAVAGTETFDTRYWAEGTDVVGDADEGWWLDTELTGKGPVTWTRTRRLRQLNINDLSTPVAVTPTSPFAHLKEAEVVMVSGQDNNLLGEGRTLRVRVLKAF